MLSLECMGRIPVRSLIVICCYNSVTLCMQQAMQQNSRDYIADVAYQACLIIVSQPSPDILS